MKKKFFIPLIVFALVFLGVGIFLFWKKDTASEEAAQLPEEPVLEAAAQVTVDETHFELLEKMMIVKDAEAFDSAFLSKPCDLYQAYEMLGTMRGQDGAKVAYSYHGEQVTQKELLSLYLKELFGIEVTEAEGEEELREESV